MKKELLITLIYGLVEDAIDSTKLPEGTRGPRGFRGKDGLDGNDFHLESHKEEIKEFVDSVVPKFLELSPEDRASLVGPRGPKGISGKDGKDGRDGKDGKDFSIEENLGHISNELDSLLCKYRDDLRLKFSDLSEEERRSLKGPRGQRGKAGHSFVYEEHENEIKQVISDRIDCLKDDLKLKFEDLSPEEVAAIKGPKGDKGKPGKDGKDFLFDEHKESVSKLIIDNKTHLKLRFQDLEEEEVESLKLKFKDLSEEDKLFLKGEKGSRGQRGKVGQTGEKGDVGPQGLRGLPGVQGVQGIQGPAGRDGEDGKDAAFITEIDARKTLDDRIYFEFYLSNGLVIETNKIKLPKTVENIYNSYAVSGGGGGSKLKIYEEGSELTSVKGLDFSGFNITQSGDTLTIESPKLNVNGVETTDLDFTGSGVTVSDDGNGTATVNIPGGSGGNAIEVCDEGDLVSTQIEKFNFIGDYITARPYVPMSEWDAMSDVEPSLAEYDNGDTATQVDIVVDPPDATIIRDVECLPDVYVGSFVYVDSSSVAQNALADDYTTSNVIGLVEVKKSSTLCDVRVSGLSEAIYSGLNPSEDYYLSDTVAGELTSSVPTDSGHVKLRLGQSFGTDRFLLMKGERVVRL